METFPTPSIADLTAAVERAVAAALDKKPDRRLLCPNAFAEAADVSRALVYELMKKGLLRYVFVGSDRRIPIEELERVRREGIAWPKDDE
ncbi:helix-turn-helix domain-containing protein [Polaromonas sp. JS666]|uniref:helix-turn-helix domain-containing protein n=1 Tax=Polaromonas sp. (strain JS666 / ATCC BAA-500) TaxID=296591 RepID=UPI00005332CA|nr:helix-turn-helix domain-containing protein [Polaromonas sp. JS666]ABE43266.1 hypothetical protein Bpro_1316 [Polaromonas sp. JS666]